MNRIINWIRRKLDKPIRFDLQKALADAQAEADAELARMADPTVVAEVASWEYMPDPITDGIGCEHEEKR